LPTPSRRHSSEVERSTEVDAIERSPAAPAARPRLARRTAGFTESVIREMTRLNAIHGGINLAQGFPDFAAPQEIKEAAVAAIRADINQYAITWGAPSLRRAVAQKYADVYGMAVDPESMVTITCGATEAMIASLLAIVDPGEEVVVLEPFYENYGPDAAICGASPVFVPLRAPDFTFDSDELRAAFSSRTKAIIVNTPNNPTGRVFSRAELETIASLCREFDVVAVTDEIYEHIRYEGEHVPIATLPGMADRTITISGFSKTFSVTGWRIGTIVARPELTNAIRKVHDFLTVGAPAPLQEAAAAALALGAPYYRRLAVEYRQRRDVLYECLEAARFEPLRPQGAYYILCGIAGFAFSDDVAFAHWLVREIGVAGVPGSSFFSRPELGRGLIRFTFAKRPETLRAAGERLLRAHQLARARR
jgi:aspartate/methionine/tyrosine aminotransferase